MRGLLIGVVTGVEFVHVVDFRRILLCYVRCNAGFVLLAQPRDNVPAKAQGRSSLLLNPFPTRRLQHCCAPLRGREKIHESKETATTTLEVYHLLPLTTTPKNMVT